MPVFLFTDIEGSTRLWDQNPQAMAEVIKRHDSLLRQIIVEHGGQVIEHTGDGVYAVFEVGQPLQAVLTIQQSIAEENWGSIDDVRLRIGLNACTSDREGVDYFRDGSRYFGLAVSHTSRIMSAGWGGQILLTPAVLNFDKLPEGAELEDLGPHMLKSLNQPQRIYNLTHPTIPWKEFPPINTLSTRPNNLPSQTTPFVNRRSEVSQIIESLKNGGCRLLTLFGLGGVGKTRLAIQTAAELIGDFQDGVFFVPLAPLQSPEQMVSSIAGTLNFSFHGSENQKLQLLNYLREKQLLLIMDNFEHLLSGVGLVADILETTPDVKILATCRERLNFAGEQVLEIRGLEIPNNSNLDNLETFSTVQLFLNAVRRSDPDFVLTTEEASAVIRICQLVAGMPLGIELAAAWVRIFSCQEIADQIEENLRFLVTQRSNVPKRHQNLYAVCDYFWEQLAGSEKEVLRKLSIFRGGFHTQAAWQVAGASTFFLSALLDRAFLRKVTITTASRPDITNQAEAWRVRYEMHAVLRQYAAEKLAEHPQELAETKARHGRYYADFLQRRDARLKGADQQAALEQIIAEMDNILTAWNWAIEGFHTDAIEMSLESLNEVYHLTNRLDDGIETFGRAAIQFNASDNKSGNLGSRLLIRQARFFARTSQPEKALALLEDSPTFLSDLDSPIEAAHCYQIIGTVARFKGQLEEAYNYLEKSLAIYREVNDPRYIAWTLIQVSDCAYRMGNFDKARQSFWECYNIHRRMGDPRGMALTLSGLGVLLNQLDETDFAVTLLQESARLYRSVNDRYGTAVSSHNLGAIALDRQDYITARPYFEESLSSFQETSNKWTLAAALNGLGIVNYELGEPEHAREYLLKALELTYNRNLLPLLLETLIQTAVIALDEDKPLLAAELLAFTLAHPALDKAEMEGRAKKIWFSVSDKLSLETIQNARQKGEKKELAMAVAEATSILAPQGEKLYHDPDRLSHRISQ
ncbi:MAG: tetratricopeptide repeat protein [Candidatus Promineifilaceae bacterium]